MAGALRVDTGKAPTQPGHEQMQSQWETVHQPRWFAAHADVDGCDERGA
jgi:hypothetical protein